MIDTADQSGSWQAYGLTFASDIELRGFATAPPESAADITIRLVDENPTHLENPTARGEMWMTAGAETLIDTPGIASYHVIGGREIRVAPRSEIGTTDTFLVGVPIGAALLHRGATLLHGSGVAIGGDAILFVGANGVGKSSLAAAFTSLGHASVCDNLAVVDMEKDRVRLRPGPSSLRLWQDMAHALDVDTERAPRVRPEMAKFVLTPASSRNDGVPMTVTAIVLLDEAREPHPQLTPRDPAQAAADLVRGVFRRRLTQALTGELLDRCVQIADTVAVHRLRRPATGCSPQQLAPFVAERLDL